MSTCLLLFVDTNIDTGTEMSNLFSVNKEI